MTNARCIDTPVSFLALERHALGELPESEIRRIDAHLERCPLCRACAEATRVPVVLPPLAASPRPQGGTVVRPDARRWRARAVAALSAISVAAAAVLALWSSDQRAHPERVIGPTRTRGGELALTIVRSHDDEVIEDARAFVEGDRLRVAITCPSGRDGDRVRVYVIEDGEAALALTSGPEFRCGNNVMIEGAFRIVGRGDADVCAVLGEPPAALEGAARVRWLLEAREGTACRHLIRLDPPAP